MNPESHPSSTQTRYPWRTMLRTVLQAAIALAGAWALIVQAMGVDQSAPFVAATLSFAAAVTRVMSLPVVNELLRTYVPWLAAEPH